MHSAPVCFGLKKDEFLYVDENYLCRQFYLFGLSMIMHIRGNSCYTSSKVVHVDGLY